MTEKIKPPETPPEKDRKPLPAELDNDTVIFSYGSLLNHEKLRELFKTRGEFKILETIDAAEAVRLARDNPQAIVILKNVCLENVRAFIVTETMLRRWYKNRGGNLQELIDAEAATPDVPQALFLYARRAEAGEKGKTLNGGLICNLSQAELSILDKYEWSPVLKREKTPELKIQNQTYFPEHITFYAGTVSTGDVTSEEKAGRAGLLNLNRKPGEPSPQARWQRNVRRKD